MKSGTINPNHMAQGGLDLNGSEEDSTESLSRTQRFEWQIQGGRGVPCDTCGAERGTVGDEAGKTGRGYILEGLEATARH